MYERQVEQKDYSPRPQHLQRYTWQKNFSIDFPEDYNLAIANTVDRNNLECSNFEELYMRFWHMGWIEKYGTSCIMMSQLLRRVLWLHGKAAHMRQVVCYWEKEEKGQLTHIGNINNSVPDGGIDAHVVVACKGYILDFAASAIMSEFGATAPRAFIALDEKDDNEYQNFGMHGQSCWVRARPPHPIIKHWRYENKENEIKESKEYFKLFAF